MADLTQAREPDLQKLRKRAEGYCVEGERCVCGGDTAGVRACCGNWRQDPDLRALLDLVASLQGENERLKGEGWYTEAHQRLDDLAFERIRTAEAEATRLREELDEARKALEKIAHPRDYDWDAADKYNPRAYGEGRVDASRQLADIARQALEPTLPPPPKPEGQAG